VHAVAEDGERILRVDVVVAGRRDALVDVTPELKKRVAVLWSLANIGTLIGLLGTVTGLIKTFSSLGIGNPADRAKTLSDGISEAMNNTAVGLGIAVTCMIGHLFLNGMSKKRQGDLEAFSMKLDNMLSDSTRHAAHQSESGSR
jgi:biopolymer transport protein ExbB/TolQ